MQLNLEEKKIMKIIYKLFIVIFLIALIPFEINARCSLNCGNTRTICKDGNDCSVDIDTQTLTCDGEKYNCDGPINEKLSKRV